MPLSDLINPFRLLRGDAERHSNKTASYRSDERSPIHH
jgi:hypothetical protein